MQMVWCDDLLAMIQKGRYEYEKVEYTNVFVFSQIKNKIYKLAWIQGKLSNFGDIHIIIARKLGETFA